MESFVETVYGKRRSGKSTYVKKKIKNFDRVFVVDSMSEYNSGLLFFNSDDIIDYFIENNPKKFFVVLRPEKIFDIEKVFKIVYEIEDVLLVLEEASKFLSAKNENSFFLDLIRFGRHRGVSVIAVVRRPQEISTDVRTNIDVITSFKQVEIHTLNLLQPYFDKDLTSLKPFEYAQNSSL